MAGCLCSCHHRILSLIFTLLLSLYVGQTKPVSNSSHNYPVNSLLSAAPPRRPLHYLREPLLLLLFFLSACSPLQNKHLQLLGADLFYFLSLSFPISQYHLVTQEYKLLPQIGYIHTIARSRKLDGFVCRIVLTK